MAAEIKLRKRWERGKETTSYATPGEKWGPANLEAWRAITGELRERIEWVKEDGRQLRLPRKEEPDGGGGVSGDGSNAEKQEKRP